VGSYFYNGIMDAGASFIMFPRLIKDKEHGNKNKPYSQGVMWHGVVHATPEKKRGRE